MSQAVLSCEAEVYGEGTSVPRALHGRETTYTSGMVVARQHLEGTEESLMEKPSLLLRTPSRCGESDSRKTSTR